MLLEIKNLSVTYKSEFGPLYALRGISFGIEPHEIVALVGESGSGKSTAAGAILNLLGSNAKHSGEVLFEGQNLLAMKSSDLQHIRGQKIGMMFQDPLRALNPVITIGEQLVEGMIKHLSLPKDVAYARGVDLLFRLGFNHPLERMEQYPFQLSGGMCQRAAFAIAIASGCELLIADEATNSLDVTTEKQVLTLLKNLGIAVLFISHDLSLVRKIADRVIVMYAGKIVDEGPSELIFDSPHHPYTKALLKSLPSLAESKQMLYVIPGSPPHPAALPSGCAYHPRCSEAMKICESHDPFDEKTLSHPCWSFYDHR